VNEIDFSPDAINLSEVEDLSPSGGFDSPQAQNNFMPSKEYQK
jgi:hypothetical protein